jgi:hypothetical protein
VDLPHKCISSRYAPARGNLSAFDFNKGASPGCFADMQKMCLYKPEIFAWNDTLPSNRVLRHPAAVEAAGNPGPAVVKTSVFTN